MLAYGATFDLTPARERHEEGRSPPAPRTHCRDAGSWMPQQFENPANLEVHRATTPREILADFADSHESTR